MTLRDELRQWGLCKTFVHQFRLIAQRVIPKLKPKRPEHTARRYPWTRYSSYRAAPPKPRPALTAVVPEQSGPGRQPEDPEPQRPNFHGTSPSVNHKSFFSFTFR